MNKTFGPLYRNDKWGPYLYMPKFLSKGECSSLVAQMSPSKMATAKVDAAGVDRKDIRSAKICALEMIPRNGWFFQRLESAVVQANFDIYGFDLCGFFEAINLIHYDESDFYDWHMDFGNKQLSHRKLSVVIQLSDSKDYEGGDLEFFNNGIAEKDQGGLILFPSYMFHKVHPVTKGVRRSLAAWISGNPYR